MTKREVADTLLEAVLRDVMLRAGTEYDEQSVLESLPELCRGRVLRTNVIRDLTDKGTASVVKFVEDVCRTDKEARTRTSDLTAAFTVWCMRHGVERINDRRFGIALEKLGYVKMSDKYRGGLTVDYAKLK